ALAGADAWLDLAGCWTTTLVTRGAAFTWALGTTATRLATDFNCVLGLDWARCFACDAEGAAVETATKNIETRTAISLFRRYVDSPEGRVCITPILSPSR